jgi:hypothetical protein
MIDKNKKKLYFKLGKCLFYKQNQSSGGIGRLLKKPVLHKSKEFG